MGQKYSSKSATGYNSSPPADDGTVSEANKVKWSTHKTKLADPIKTLSDDINTALVAHFDRGPTAITTATTLAAAHYNEVIEASGTSEITLTDASTLTAGWFCDIINVGSGNIPINRATASDTIDEISADITLFPLDAIRVTVNAGADGFMTSKRGLKANKGTDVASATALAVPNNGDYFDVTGTTTITSINSIGIGKVIKLHFDGALTLTHHATDLVLPGGANITTAAGDEAEFIEYASGDWRCTNYTKASGKAITLPTASDGAAMVLLSSASASSDATIEFIDVFDAIYDNYILMFNYVLPETNAVNCYARFSPDSGSTWRATGYHYANGLSATALLLNYSGDGATARPLSNSSDAGLSGQLLLFSPANSAKQTVGTFIGAGEGSGIADQMFALHGAGKYSTAEEHDSLQIFMSSGNIASGEFALYGVRNA